jgi:D-3-phosphoglycerate dehydrogenase
LLAVGCYCIGTNQVNINSANEHGVAIFNSPFSNTRSVAELVIANCIMLLRKIQTKNTAAHNGIWLKDSSDCYEVRGKTLGLIGYGHIGTQVSILAEAMGMNVIFYDIESKLSLGNARASKNLNALLREAHIVSLHVPATASTRNMVNESFLKKMRKGAALINLSRGDVMDVRAVRKAVKQNMLAGVAVDVFPSEPENKGDVFKSPLQHLPNVILTPHIGGSTEEAQENIGIDVASKVIRFINTGSSVGSVSIPPLSLPVQNKSHRILHIHHNVPGVLSEINAVMVSYKANILGQYLQTNNQVGYVAIDIDKKTISAIIEDLKKVKETIRVRNLY